MHEKSPPGRRAFRRLKGLNLLYDHAYAESWGRTAIDARL
jgi:hypothetical protein